MRKLFILTLLLSLSYQCQARIARFYFSRAYVCSCRADRYDCPIDGNFIITFNTTEKTITVYYNVPGIQPYSYTTKYKSVEEHHFGTSNTDYYKLAGALFGGENDYIIANTYSKREGYGVSFFLPDTNRRSLFGDKFLKFFGHPSDWEYWPEVFFEKPYKHDTNPKPDYSRNPSQSNSRAGSQISLVNRIYSGTFHTSYEQYLDIVLTLHFISPTKCRMKMDGKIQGADYFEPFQIIQMMLEASGEDSYEDVFEYTYRNGVISIKNSTDRFKVLEGGKKLKYYIESKEEGAKAFNAILERIR